jgi:hypothetical protein
MTDVTPVISSCDLRHVPFSRVLPSTIVQAVVSASWDSILDRSSASEMLPQIFPGPTCCSNSVWRIKREGCSLAPHRMSPRPRRVRHLPEPPEPEDQLRRLQSYCEGEE